MKIAVKNMVCRRCILAVEQILNDLKIEWNRVDLGIVELKSAPSVKKLEKFDQRLNELGFERLADKQAQLINQVKSLLTDIVYGDLTEFKENLSDYLTKHIAQDYSSISKLFSDQTGKTIERFFIGLKIERVKELLVYNELTLSEIAHQLSYSSVAYLSAQFKQVTGETPSVFRKNQKHNRQRLENL